jgi:hypothetical protein
MTRRFTLATLREETQNLYIGKRRLKTCRYCSRRKKLIIFGEKYFNQEIQELFKELKKRLER